MKHITLALLIFISISKITQAEDSLGLFSEYDNLVIMNTHVDSTYYALVNSTSDSNSSKDSYEYEKLKELKELKKNLISEKSNINHASNTSVILLKDTEIENQMPQHLGEALQKKTGFSQRSGFQTPLTLRGLNGKRLLILRNGNRRFSSYPAGYMTHTLNIYDLDRVEVNKGVSSVMHGSGAIAGVINLIDKSPFNDDGFSAKISSNYNTNNHEKAILAGGAWASDNFALKVNGRYRDADEFKYPNEEIATNSFYKTKDFSLGSGYKINKKQEILLNIDIHDGGPWGKPVGFNGTDYMYATTNSEKTQNYSLNYKFKDIGFLSEFNSALFFSNENREMSKEFFAAANFMPTYTETTTFSDYYYGFKTNANLKLNNNHNILAGAEGYSFHVSTPTDAVDYVNNLSFRNRVSDDARSYLLGLFVEDQYALTKKVTLSSGIRYDYSKLFQGNVLDTNQEKETESSIHSYSGRVGTKYKINTKSILKINLARSFRMPETAELFRDTYTSNGILYGNQDLKPEYTKSLDLNYQYFGRFFSLDFSPYLWLIDEMIDKEEVNGQPGTNYQYINITKARIWGGEISLRFPWDDFLNTRNSIELKTAAAYINATDITSSKTFDEGEPLDFVPPFNIKSELSFESDSEAMFSLNMNLYNIYYRQQTRLGEDSYVTPSYFLWDLAFSLSANKWYGNPHFRFLIKNLTNNEYKTYGSYLNSPGRDFRFSLSFNF